MPRRVSLVVFLGLAVVFVLATGISAGAAPQGSVQEKRQEVSSAEDRLAQLRTEASASYEEYNNALYELNQLDGKIEATSEDLDAAEERLAGARRELENRASQVYKSGNVAFVDVLVGVDSFSEFTTRLNLWLRVLAEDRAQFNAVLEAKNELQAKQEELKKQREERAAKVRAAAERRDSAEAAAAEAENYLESLNGELAALIQAGEQRRAEQARAAAARASAQPAPEVAPAVQVSGTGRVEAARAAAAEARRRAELAAQRAAERREAAEQAQAEREAARQEAARQRAAERAEQARAAAEQAAIDQAAAEQAAQQAAAEQAAAEQQQAAARQQDRSAGSGGSSAGSTSGGGGGSVTGSAVVAEAETWLGTPYVWGGTSRSGVDCSGLTMMVYSKFGISLPRTAEAQFGVGTPVSSPAPGDMVFFGSGGSITSVGIVTGPDTAIKATVPGDVVRYVSISEVGAATGGVAGYRRVL